MLPITDSIKGKHIKQEDILTARNIVLNKINENIKIKYPNFNENFALHTDSSNRTCSGVLTQSHGIVGIFSHKFNETEEKYNVMEKEFLGILLSLKKFKYLILDKLTIVNTDNKNLTYDTPVQNSRLQRWKLLLSEFNIRIEHVKGSENCLPDFLSRLNSIVSEPPENDFIKNLVNGLSDPLESEKKCFTLRQDDHLSCYITQNKIFIPKEDAKEFCKKLHSYFGHPGMSNFYKTIKKYFFIYKIKRMILQITKYCKECTLCKVTKHNYGKIIGNIAGTKLNDKVSIDHLGPFVNTKLNEKLGIIKFWIFVIVENFSKFTKLYLVKNLQPDNTLKALKKYIEKFNKPNKIISDQGKTFMSKKFKEFLTDQEILHINIIPYNPESNSIVERRNRIILEILKMYKFNNIKEYFKKAELKLNHIISTSTGYSPSQLMLHQNPFDLIKQDDYELILNKAARQQDKTNKSYTDQLNKKRICHEYNPGETVVIRNTEQGKLKRPYFGPAKIIERSEKGNRLLLEYKGKRMWKNLKQIKPLFLQEEVTVMSNNIN